MFRDMKGGYKKPKGRARAGRSKAQMGGAKGMPGMGMGGMGGMEDMMMAMMMGDAMMGMGGPGGKKSKKGKKGKKKGGMGDFMGMGGMGGPMDDMEEMMMAAAMMYGDEDDGDDMDLFGVDEEYDSDEVEMIGKQMGLNKKEMAELKKDLKRKYNKSTPKSTKPA